MTDLDGADPGAAGLRQAAHDVVDLSDNRNIFDEGRWRDGSPLTWNSALRSDECVAPREYGPPSMKKLGKLGEATPRYALAPSSNICHIAENILDLRFNIHACVS